MPEAFIYDHVRTPRGRGKKDGALHEVSTAVLAAGTLSAIRDRNDLDPATIDDVILGCVDPVGEAGGDIARNAVFAAGFPHTVPGMQVNRYCASGLDAVNLAHAAITAGQHDMIVAGGVESMSRVGLGAAGNAWAVDPQVALPGYFVPQGVSADLIATKYGFSRTDVDAYAVESQKRAAAAWEEGRFARSIAPVKDINGLTILARDEHMRPDTSMQGLAALTPSFALLGEMGGFDSVGIAAHPEVEAIDHVHHAGNSSGVVDGAAAVLVASKTRRQEGRPDAAREDPRLRQYRLRAGDHAHRAGGRDAQAVRAHRHELRRHRPHRDQRGLRLRGAALPAGLRPRSGQGQRQWRRHRHGPSARRHRRHDPRHGASTNWSAATSTRRW